MLEYLRPWKLVSYACGLGILFFGAWNYRYDDWDYGVSLVMGGVTYLTAPWGLRTLRRREWGKVPAAMFCYWLAVDGSYVAYNAMVGRPVSHEIRVANFWASTCLYALCAWIWEPDVDLRGRLGA